MFCIPGGSQTRGDDARGDPLRKRLRRRGIELICPHKKNRVRPTTQDGRALRRYRRRWIVERTIGWLGNFRHLVVRYDRSLPIYRAFFHIACFMIVLRRVVQYLLLTFLRAENTSFALTLPATASATVRFCSRGYILKGLKKWCALGDDFRTFCANQILADLPHLSLLIGL